MVDDRVNRVFFTACEFLEKPKRLRTGGNGSDVPRFEWLPSIVALSIEFPIRYMTLNMLWYLITC
jgi:hypothetical protein